MSGSIISAATEGRRLERWRRGQRVRGQAKGDDDRHACNGILAPVCAKGAAVGTGPNGWQLCAPDAAATRANIVTPSGGEREGSRPRIVEIVVRPWNQFRGRKPEHSSQPEDWDLIAQIRSEAGLDKI